MMRKCKHCCRPLRQRDGEDLITFLNRHYCSVSCIIAEQRARGYSAECSPAMERRLAEVQALAREALAHWGR